MTAVVSGRRTQTTSASAHPGASRTAGVVVVLASTLLGLGLCLTWLTGRSLGFDESATVAITSQHGHALSRAIAHDGGNMSGYYLLMHVLIGAFGEGPWVLRLPSAVFGSLTAGLIAAIALTLWRDVRAALIAGVLAAVSVPVIYWGQTARGYSGMLCFACLGTLALVRYVQAGEAGRRTSGWAVTYGVAMAIAAYGGFIVLLVVLAHALAMLGRPRRVLAGFAAAVAGTAVLCIPIAVLATRRGSNQLFWIARPTGQSESQGMQTLTSSGSQAFHQPFTTTPGWIIIAVLIVGTLVWSLWAGRRGPGDRLAGFGVRLALLWAIVPGLFELVWSLVAQPVFIPRNLFLSVPAVALALAALLADRRLPRLLAVIAVAVVLAIRVVPVVGSYGAQPEPWRQVSAWVLEHSRPGDCVTFYPEDARNAFRYYVARDDAWARAPRSVLPAVPWSSTRPFVELYPSLSPTRVASLRSSCRRMWLISSHEGQSDGPAEARMHRAQWHVLQARLSRVFGRGHVNGWGYASQVHFALYARPAVAAAPLKAP